MKCDNLKAYLDGQLGLFDRLLMLAHVRLCAPCRQNRAEWLSLSRQIERLEDEPVPSALKDRLITDAVTAAASARARSTSSSPERPRVMEVLKMRKAPLAAGLVVILVAIGFWLLPSRRGDFALADVARAMSKVKSVHFVGWKLDSSGNRKKMEGWIKGSSKVRWRTEGAGYVNDAADDGERVVEIWGSGGFQRATIRPSKGSAEWSRQGLSADLFYGHGLLRDLQDTIRPYTVTSRQTALPDGRRVVVYELNRPSDKTLLLLTVDRDTDLIVRAEGFKDLESGREKTLAIERIEYNVEIPDSVFRLAIPRGAQVTDLLSPLPAAPADVVERREAEKKRLRADPHAHVFLDIGEGRRGSGGTAYHPSFRFEVTEYDGIMVAYVPDRNIYRVVGRARVYSKDGSYSQIAEDEDIRLPGEPQYPEPVLLLDGGRPGAYCGLKEVHPRNSQFRRFLNVGDGPLTIATKGHMGKRTFFIKGTAKLLPFGTVYRNLTVKENDLPGIEAIRSLPKLDWGSLPASEVEIAKAELDVAMRLDEIMSTRDAEGRVLIDGERVKIKMQAGGGYQAHRGLKFEAAGIGPTACILRIESKDEHKFVIIGTVRVLPSGEICKNGRVSYGGEVISSEE